MTTRYIHCSIAKERLVAEIRRLGLRAVLVVPDGVTQGDMLAMIDRDPREVFTLSECDNQNPDGSCAGHEREADR